MSDCPYCGRANAYNSGFSVECTNPSCRSFSVAHQRQTEKDGVTSAAPQQDRKLKVSLERLDKLRITPEAGHTIEVDLCYSDKLSYHFARWNADTSCSHTIAGRPFFLTLSLADNSPPQIVELTLVGSAGDVIYNKTISFDSKNNKFEVTADS